MYVIEKDGVVTRGPSGWTQNLAKACGLGGNKTAPVTPFTLADGSVLRSVVTITASKLEYQNDGPETRELVNGVYTITQSVIDYNAEQVAAAKPGLKKKADKWAEDERAKYVTAIWGQETVYLEKEKEAKEFAAWDGQGVPPDSPYIDAEVAATGQTKQNLVNLILANSAAWRVLSVQIESKRMALKAAVDNATTAADLRAIEW
jgi:hypothetical protein